MKVEIMTQYNSPHMEQFANGFATWLARKMGGRLPAPRIHVIGASEKLWPVLFETSKRTMGTAGREEWRNNSDACTFPFLSMGEDSQPKRLDRETKAKLLPWLFPYHPKSFVQTLTEFDAVIFLRLHKMPDPRRQFLIAACEAAFICAIWLGKPLNIEDEQVSQWVGEFSTEGRPTSRTHPEIRNLRRMG